MVEWREFSRGAQALGAGISNILDPSGGEARALGMSIDEWKKFKREMFELERLNKIAALSHQKAQTEDLMSGLKAQDLANEESEANMRAMSGGLRPGEERSRYQPLPVGAENPLPDRPIQRNVGFDTREDAVAQFKGTENQLKIAKQLFDQYIDRSNLARNEKRYELDVREADRREQQLGVNRTYVNSVIARNAAEIQRIRTEAGGKNKLSPAQAASIAKSMTDDELSFEDEVSPEKRMETFKGYYDQLLGVKSETEDFISGPGSIENNFGAFEDEKKLSGEEAAVREENERYALINAKKQATTQLEQAHSALSKERIQAMTPQERALDSSIPLTAVLDLGPEAAKRALQQDMKQFEEEIRRNIAMGVPVEQWSDGALAFIQALESGANNQ